VPISTRDLSKLPGIDDLKRLMQSLAMLDAILSPEWEFRYYSFNSKWARGEEMGSMRTGSGDDFFALFNKHGCFLKGFDHESAMSPYRETPKRLWPGVLDGVPKEFDRALKQPAFSMEDTTFCIWRRYGDRKWHRGKIEFPKGEPNPDGSSRLLSELDGKPATYLRWARDYYSLDDEDANRSLTLAQVRHVYAHEPLTAEMVKVINPEVTLAKLAADIAEIGYTKGKK
jgi:hypothetical protein